MNEYDKVYKLIKCFQHSHLTPNNTTNLHPYYGIYGVQERK